VTTTITDVRLKEPRSGTRLWLDLTRKCQLSCTHCYNSSGPDGTHGAMRREDWLRVLDEAPACGMRSVQFIGGEPTMHPDFRELVEHALGLGLQTEVFSNLVHVSDECWQLFDHGNLSLATSYYSDRAETHNAMTGRPSHQRTRTNIARAVRRGIPLRVGIIGSDPEVIAAAQRDLAELGVTRIGVDRVRPFGRGGLQDPPDAEKVPATTETPFCVYSASKAITAAVVHMLHERGLLDIDERVCAHIPEFGSHGKDAITVAQVLAHRAGVPNHPPEVMDLDTIGDRELILRALCEAKPFAKPGRLVAYHALSGGAILGEIVHRVTGKSIRDVLAEEILTPLGFRWTNYGVAPDDVAAVGTNYLTGPPVGPPISTMLKRLLGVPIAEAVRLTNDARYLTATVPAGNVVSPADELSRFFELLRRGGELDGVRVLDPATIRRAVTRQTRLEVDFTFGVPVPYSAGFMLGSRRLSLFGPDTESVFGHLGFTNILAWADPERALSVGLITSGNPVIYPEVFDFLGIMGRIGSAAPKVDTTTGRGPASDN
jgi:CubicO group peptidase (beta-lactamase class C family)